MALDYGGSYYQGQVLGEADLIGYWMGQDATGSATAVDSGPNGLDGEYRKGTAADSAVRVDGPQAGVFAQRFVSAVAADQRRVRVNNNALLSPSGAMSWEWIVRYTPIGSPVGGAGSSFVGDKTSEWSVNTNVLVLANEESVYGLIENTGGDIYADSDSSANPVTPDTWHHWGLAWDGAGTWDLAIDGIEVATVDTGPVGTRRGNTANPLLMWECLSSPRDHRHDICHTALYARRLSVADFRRHLTPPAGGWSPASITW